jgi:AcrR family transcriptional regulator
MVARAYSMQNRRQALALSRAHALRAACSLLARDDCRELNLDSVARAAGVTRATLYNHFGSRAGLLLAVFQELGRRMKAESIHAAMRLPDPQRALAAMLHESTQAWARERELVRKVFALAVLDPEMRQEVERAEQQRRHSLLHLAKRLAAAGVLGISVSEAAALLAGLSSFQAFEALAVDAAPKLVERRLLELSLAGLGMARRQESQA